jgi:hypothetical protein
MVQNVYRACGEPSGEPSGEQRRRAEQRIDSPTPTKKVLQLHEGLIKRQSALPAQLHTERIGLNDFLFARRVPGITSSRYQCGERRRTVAHILLHCRTHKDLLNQVFGNLFGRHSLQAMLSKPQLVTKVIEFVEQAQILGQVEIADA